jgi:hypothetical protein
MNDIEELQRESEKRHQEVLDMIETLFDTSSDQESTVRGRAFSENQALTFTTCVQISGVYSCSYNRSESILYSIRNSPDIYYQAPIQSQCSHQSPKFSMVEIQNCLIFSNSSIKTHLVSQFWVQVEWEKQV